MTRGCCDEQSIVLFCCFVVKKNNNVSDAESMRQLDSSEKCPFWDIILVEIMPGYDLDFLAVCPSIDKKSVAKNRGCGWGVLWIITQLHGVKKSYTELLECAVTARNKTKDVMYDCFTVLPLEIRIANPGICPLNFKFRGALRSILCSLLSKLI